MDTIKEYVIWLQMGVWPYGPSSRKLFDLLHIQWPKSGRIAAVHLQAMYPRLPFNGRYCTMLTNVRLSLLLVAVHCGLLTAEHVWSRSLAIFLVTAALPLPGQRCGTVCSAEQLQQPDITFRQFTRSLKTFMLGGTAVAPRDFYV